MTLRKKIIIVSLFTIISVQVLNIMEIPYFKGIEQREIINASIVAFIILLGTIWALGGHIRRQTIIPVLIFPVWLGFIFTLFLEVGIFQNAVRFKDRTIGLGILFVMGIGMYILLLTANILAVTYYKNIPLGRAARASSYVFTLIGVYFTLLLLVNLNLFFPFKVIGVFVSVLYFCFANIWHLRVGLKNNFILSLSITSVVTIIFLALSLWPIPAQFFSLVLTLCIYMFLGLALEQKDNFSRAVWVEYAVLAVIITVILFKASVWGINGTFLGL